MLEKLINLFKDFCAAFAMALAAYFYGKETAENEQKETEAEKLKAGLTAAMHGDYSADAVRERMQQNDD